ncbi:thioredoxin-like protein, partial [Dactylonectria macrodidyma]
WAEWVGPCKLISPFYDSLSESLSRPNLITFGKIDCDIQTDLIAQFEIVTLPTFILFREGEEFERVLGTDVRKLQSIIQK